MGKVSVRYSVAQAYGLLFGRPLTVIGLTWLPAVFYGMGTDYLFRRIDVAMALAPSANGLPSQYAFFYFAAFLVLTALFGAVVAVPLTRQSFGLREEPVAVHFVIGARELRLFLALLRYYILVMSLLVLFAVGAGVGITQATHYAATHGMPSAWQSISLETWLNSAAGLLAVILFGILAIRYGFFLDAVAAAEDRTRLSRARSLARNNFWSLAAVMVAVGLPATLILVACEMTFGGLSAQTIGSADAATFAAILTGGLVVLHVLFAGASAGAYSELADAAAHEAEPFETAHDLSPALVYAQAQAAETAKTLGPVETIRSTEHHAAGPTIAAVATPAMEIATPEAEGASAAARQGDWMAPPPDAHFGSDPHDAQPQHPPTDFSLNTEPLAAAVAAVESAHPVETQTAALPANGSAAAGTDAPELADTAQMVGFDGHPAEMPDEAQKAEFPPPPLDPTGAISAQSGFHSPG